MIVNTHSSIRFCAVGLMVSGIDFGATTFVFYFFHQKTLAVYLGVAIGFIASYLLHARITFATSLNPQTQLPKLLLLFGINAAMTDSVIRFCMHFLASNFTIAKILSLPVVAGCSYVVSRYWVYR